MHNLNIEDCQLNDKGKCTCYLKQCWEVSDCAPKLIIKKNMLVVNKLLNE